MKPASLSQLKQELKIRSKEELVELCLSLTRYKKENKELLTYLLFEAADEFSYVKEIKSEIDEQFSKINKSTPYFIKKGVRKILRDIKKHIKYSKKKETEVELLIYFCRKLKAFYPSLSRNTTLQNIYDRQVELIVKSVKSLHEDLQYDYAEELAQL
ncbi:MAG: hypothetical protein PHE56_15605 [Bacteroidales bacterium]|nr:hypothetical protein [Bacteroidales bacterium]